MDMVTNLRNLQSNAGDEQKPSAGTNGGGCYEVREEEMRKQSNNGIILQKSWTERVTEKVFF